MKLDDGLYAVGRLRGFKSHKPEKIADGAEQIGLVVHDQDGRLCGVARSDLFHSALDW